jgi:L-histidine N-alpha-methyltransferase
VGLEVRVLLAPGSTTLADDVLTGFRQKPKALPPKHFYDDRGSALFDRICQTPEYYATRTELRLLEQVAPHVFDSLRPTHVVELGSGAARKTEAVLDSAERVRCACEYVPFDVSESMLRASALRLLSRYPWLTVRGIVGDYERHLREVPTGSRRLFMFLGSTIGNFEHAAAVSFLSHIADSMGESDRLLLGTDLVKDRAVLDRAYNDAEGLTAAFNKNMLLVLNRELQAAFNPEDFEHVAYFDEPKRQIEMHLEARRAVCVPLRALGSSVTLARGERILTEISRKFTRGGVAELLRESGLELCSWHEPANGYFGVSVARRVTQL